MTIQDALNLVQILLAVVLILVVILQAKGSSLGGIFGGDSSGVYRTRRGFERRLFQFTIFVAAAFLLVAIINSLVTSPT